MSQNTFLLPPSLPREYTCLCYFGVNYFMDLCSAISSMILGSSKDTWQMLELRIYTFPKTWVSCHNPWICGFHRKLKIKVKFGKDPLSIFWEGVRKLTVWDWILKSETLTFECTRSLLIALIVWIMFCIWHVVTPLIILLVKIPDPKIFVHCCVTTIEPIYIYISIGESERKPS